MAKASRNKTYIQPARTKPRLPINRTRPGSRAQERVLAARSRPGHPLRSARKRWALRGLLGLLILWPPLIAGVLVDIQLSYPNPSHLPWFIMAMGLALAASGLCLVFYRYERRLDLDRRVRHIYTSDAAWLAGALAVVMGALVALGGVAVLLLSL